MVEQQLHEFLVSGAEIVRDPVRTNFAQFLGKGLEDARDADAVIFGVPFDLGTQHHVGTQLGPAGVRRAFSLYRPYSVELGIDFGEHLKVADIGNVSVEDYKVYDKTFGRVDAVVDWIAGEKKIPIMIGGDDSTTFPTVSAFARHHERVGLIWLDAHFDCAGDFRGDTLHCGTPLGNLITQTDGVIRAENVIHIGARSYVNYAQTSRNALELGFAIRTAEDVGEQGARSIIEEAIEIVRRDTDTFWIAFDVDVLDAVYAPGTQSPRPGGLTSREILTMIRAAALAGAGGLSVVEVAPLQDVGDATSMVAAASIMELLGGLAARRIPNFSRPGAQLITSE